MEGDVVKLRMAEMLVGRMNLKYQDKKTGDIKDEGTTKPEVIMRQLCTRPGQVCPHPHTPVLLLSCHIQALLQAIDHSRREQWRTCDPS